LSEQANEVLQKKSHKQPRDDSRLAMIRQQQRAVFAGKEGETSLANQGLHQAA
jgi:hypothetical protein